jgi:ABC-2 type transport system permease protein
MILFNIFFSFFISLGAGVLADAFAPISQTGTGVDPNIVLKHANIQRVISLFSPMTLYSEATTTILNPLMKTTQSLILMGPMERLSISRFQSPLPLSESVYIVLPLIISLIAITSICLRKRNR